MGMASSTLPAKIPNREKRSRQYLITAEVKQMIDAAESVQFDTLCLFIADCTLTRILFILGEKLDLLPTGKTGYKFFQDWPQFIYVFITTKCHATATGYHG